MLHSFMLISFPEFFTEERNRRKTQFSQISLLGKHPRERDWKLQTVSLQLW